MKNSRLGVVVLVQKNLKTASVKVSSLFEYPKYLKRVIRTKKKIVDCSKFPLVKVGSIVKIDPCRPISARKRFFISSIIK
jgi:ribosomal protein S17